MGRTVNQQGTGCDVEKINEGTCKIDGQQEHQIHNEQEDWYPEKAVQDDTVNALGPIFDNRPT